MNNEVVPQNDTEGLHELEYNAKKHMIYIPDVVHVEQQVHDIEKIKVILNNGDSDY